MNSPGFFFSFLTKRSKNRKKYKCHVLKEEKKRREGGKKMGTSEGIKAHWCVISCSTGFLVISGSSYSGHVCTSVLMTNSSVLLQGGTDGQLPASLFSCLSVGVCVAVPCPACCVFLRSRGLCDRRGRVVFLASRVGFRVGLCTWGRMWVYSDTGLCFWSVCV